MGELWFFLELEVIHDFRCMVDVGTQTVKTFLSLKVVVIHIWIQDSVAHHFINQAQVS